MKSGYSLQNTSGEIFQSIIEPQGRDRHSISKGLVFLLMY